MSHVSCWPSTLGEETIITHDSAETVLEIMQEQAAYLEKETDGKVEAVFAYANFIPQKESEVTADISSAYSGTDYALTIYNGRYFFKILTVRVSAFYPVTIIPDSGVFDEAKNNLPRAAMEIESKSVCAYSETELLEILRSLFATRKVKWMICKLLGIGEVQREKN